MVFPTLETSGQTPLTIKPVTESSNMVPLCSVERSCLLPSSAGPGGQTDVFSEGEIEVHVLEERSETRFPQGSRSSSSGPQKTRRVVRWLYSILVSQEKHLGQLVGYLVSF